VIGDKILLVDDQQEVTGAIARELRKLCMVEGLSMVHARNAKEALEKLGRGKGEYAVILSDLRMEGMNGINLLKVAAERWPDTVRMVLTGMAELESIQDILDAGLHAYLKKPWDREKLVMEMRRAVAVHDLKRKDTEHRAALERVAYTVFHELSESQMQRNILRRAAAYLETGSLNGAR